MSTVAIPPLMAPVPSSDPPPLLTAEEFFTRFQNRRCELVKGQVRETPMPDYLHGFICLEMGALLREFVKKHQLGRAMSNDSFVKVRKNPDSVFGADVCFISYERLPRGPIPSGLLDAVPELVVEVRSPSDAWTEIMVKVFDYLAAGVRAVVVFNSARPAVAVYRSEGDEEFFSLDQELVIPEILPGFRVAVRRFFEGSSP